MASTWASSFTPFSTKSCWNSAATKALLWPVRLLPPALTPKVLGRVAATYGFTVSGDGAGTATVNVGSNGDAFGVANNTTMTLMDLLLAAHAQAVNGVLYYGKSTRRNEANTVYSALNDAGGIS